jgi:hypothetical protein
MEPVILWLGKQDGPRVEMGLGFVIWLRIASNGQIAQMLTLW